MQKKQASELLLQAALEQDIPSIVQCLEQGANPNCKDKSGESPLTLLLQCSMAAVFHQSFSGVDSRADLTLGVEALIQAGAKIDCRSSEGETPLYIAVDAYNDLSALKLIELGANVNAKDRRGNSILMIAVQNNLENVVDSLLTRGADTSTQSRAGSQVMSYLHSDASPSLARMLVQHGADPKADHSSCLSAAVRYKAAKFNDFTLVNELIQLGADINARGNGDGETSLMFLARHGTKEEDLVVARVRLALGADPSLTNDFGQTAFDIALECENFGIANILNPEHQS